MLNSSRPAVCACGCVTSLVAQPPPAVFPVASRPKWPGPAGNTLHRDCRCCELCIAALEASWSTSTNMSRRLTHKQKCETHPRRLPVRHQHLPGHTLRHSADTAACSSVGLGDKTSRVAADDVTPCAVSAYPGAPSATAQLLQTWCVHSWLSTQPPQFHPGCACSAATRRSVSPANARSASASLSLAAASIASAHLNSDSPISWPSDWHSAAADCGSSDRGNGSRHSASCSSNGGGIVMRSMPASARISSSMSFPVDERHDAGIQIVSWPNLRR
mmetsp:Transcript_17703/g.53114  ORF Transcript_17703/g.53114 Transcript_17703/m.53114 type:complete len:274 (-) Transcript_17703:844-1665(-)